MVFKDLEGSKQARKELAEKESKVLLTLQGGKPAQPKAKPSQMEMINVSFEDYKQFQSMFKADSEADIPPGPMVIPQTLDTLTEMNNLKTLLEEELDVNNATHSFFPYMNALLEAEMEVEEASPGSYAPNEIITSTSPTYLAFKEKMEKLRKRTTLKSLIKKLSTKGPGGFDLSLVDNVLDDEQVEAMTLICLKLDAEMKGSNSIIMPKTDPFGNLC